MKRYRERIKTDQSRHAEYLENETKRWKRQREENKLPPLVEDMTQKHSSNDENITPEAKRGRKNLKKKRANMYRRIKQLEQELLQK
ncbi:hypothetical protein DPMN_001326 [Dreissena polymorpha]|uniref:Uncharacterized protein n=1 Tax=Dreissena polymorpha TaxID=45954 RepID=A0A9D4MK36_DREPO|nr:hypothetical protein DPMN_001326 [Dreissena polymorpha]